MRAITRKLTVASVLPALLIVTACQQGIPPEALKLSRTSLQERELETRQFDTTDEAKMLAASAGVLQDLGFTLDDSETKLGLIVASKDRDATETGQVVGAIIMALLIGAYIPPDQKQKIRVSLVTHPVAKQPDEMSVRVTFQRIVWNTQGKISKEETLGDPKLYQEFFDRLSKAVFLEAHNI